jgi:micrococcal nuclease
MARSSATLIGFAIAISCGLPSSETAAAQDVVPATAIRVIDGDTVEVQGSDGTTSTVRLIGIDTPESVAPATPVECQAEEAADNLRTLIEGKPVTLVADPTQDRQDRFGRTLAYVEQAGVDAGEAQIRAGYADLYYYAERDFQRSPSYEAAWEEAQAAARGVWGACEGNFHRPSDQGTDVLTAAREESAERHVRRYYFLLNHRRYRGAWALLSRGLHGRLGSLAHWRAGFRRTIGTRVNDVAVTLVGGKAVVRVKLRARDRDACSGRAVRQFFRARWVLVRRGDSWIAQSVSARKVGGGTPRLSRSECAPRRPRRTPSTGGGGGGGGGRPDCHPSYSPCVPNDRSDYDCGELNNGPYEVKGPDEYGLDGDNDGVGCE